MKKSLIKTISAFIFGTVLLAISTGSASAAGNVVMSVSATILSKSICKFKTATVNLAFGALNPLSPVDTPATATAIFDCKGSAPIVTYMITHDSGLYSIGPGGSRMRHTTNLTAYLPYSLTLSPASASFPRETPPQDHTVTVIGKVLGTDYQTALLGNYTDTVTLTINP